MQSPFPSNYDEYIYEFPGYAALGFYERIEVNTL